jgi:hypothetical protein
MAAKDLVFRTPTRKPIANGLHIVAAAAKSGSDLQNRIASRKQLLIAEIVDHKKNSCRAGAAEAIDKLKGHLNELAYIVKEDMVGGWVNVAPAAKLKLEEWISR